MIRKNLFLLSSFSVLVCSVIYHFIYEAVNHSGDAIYSIVWAPNAYIIILLWLFCDKVTTFTSFFTLFMTVTGFNIYFFYEDIIFSNIYEYVGVIVTYTLNNSSLILLSLFMIQSKRFSKANLSNDEIQGFIFLLGCGIAISFMSSIPSFIYKNFNVDTLTQFTTSNIITFSFLISNFYAFRNLDVKVMNDHENIRALIFPAIVIASSVGVYYIVLFNPLIVKSSHFLLFIMLAFSFLIFIKNTISNVIAITIISTYLASISLVPNFTTYELTIFISFSTGVGLMLQNKEKQLVSQLNQSIAALKESQLIDPLTKLLNKEGFRNKFHQISKTTDEYLVVYADLNKFKEINDFLGHSAGDLVLKIVAKRILFIMKDNCYVSRLGGDEFAFIMYDSISASINKCQALLGEINKPMIIGGNKFTIDMSIGISIFPTHGSGLDELLHFADIAMYTSKKSFLRKPVIFESGMGEIKKHNTFHFNQNFNIFDILNECYPLYQPIFKVTDKVHEVVSFEILLRHKNLYTLDILNWAEEYGHMNEIFKFMADRAVEMILQSNLPVTVNVSPSQLVPNANCIIKYLGDLIEMNNLPPFNLNIEITESIPILEQDAFNRAIAAIKKLGVKIYLDDFGSGYSFYSVLSAGNFDVIKIDRTLINDIQNSPSRLNLLNSIVTYASSSNLDIVAEGIESFDELSATINVGINYFQGYHLSKPVLMADALKCIKGN